MLSKNECRSYINERKEFLNVSRICREVGVAQPHVSLFLKSSEHNYLISIDKLNKIVSFIQSLS